LAVTLDKVKKLGMPAKRYGKILLVSIEVLEDAAPERVVNPERAESVRTGVVAFGCLAE
jgi:hypothetical protein